MKQNPCRYCRLSFEYKGRYFPQSKYECISCENRFKHEKYLFKKRKYSSGEVITSIEELLKEEFVMWNDSIRHIEVIKSLQTRTLLLFLEKGCFKKAVKNEK